MVTFGFDTAVSFATECLDRLHSTAEAHRRVMVVEVMGRYAGWIALNAGVSGTADAILIPEIPYDLERVADKIRERDSQGRGFAIVVVAEGRPAEGRRPSPSSRRRLGSAERLGGAGEQVARGDPGRDRQRHAPRGARPPAARRLADDLRPADLPALRRGGRARPGRGKSGVMVALDPPTVRYVPLAEATERMKTVPLDCDTVLTARELGICLGD